MVLHLYPHDKTFIQFQPSLSPANWLWNKLPCISDYSKTFSQVLQIHKEMWWDKLISEIFEVEKEPKNKRLKVDTELSRIENRRNLYDFADSKHTDNPAKIEVGKPHDRNPASYEDTKKIVREESIKAGISKYGAGKRSWFAFVCDGSPYKNFLSLFNILFFCKSCKVPCGEMKKHINEKHGGKTDDIQMEFDHVLPLCGPGHVEKNVLSAAISVLWNLIGFEKIAAVCNFKSKAQHDFLKKVKDHHIAADFLIICLQTLSREIVFEFGKEWKKTHSTIPTFSDLRKYFTPGSKWIKNVNLARIFSLVNGPLLSTFMLRTGVRCSNAELYYGAIQDCLSLLYHNKHSNYIKMLHFELAMIQSAPKDVKEFIFKNIFQRNHNHNNENTGQGIDYKLEEYNKLFKNFEVSASPSIDDWTKIASAAPKFKKILENQSADYDLDVGLYSEPGAPDYRRRIAACTNQLRSSEALNAVNAQDVKNLDGKYLNKSMVFNYQKEYDKRRNSYFESVAENKSFIKAELDFAITSFII